VLSGPVVQVAKPTAALDEPTRVVPITKGTSAKSFAQVLSKTTVIPHCQFPKTSLKGDDFAIKIPKNEYKSNLDMQVLGIVPIEAQQTMNF